jgi:hypothetical protein
MSSIKLESNASGTGIFTIASPNSNTNRTLTLPDNTGTILTTGGTIAASQLPAGSVLQVVQTTKNDTTSTTTTGSFVDITGMSVSITPSSASNKVLVMFSITTSNSTADQNDCIQLVRDSTNIASGTGAGTVNCTLFMRENSNASVQTGSMTFLDSPATTSAVTYKLQWRAQSGGTLYLNRRGINTDLITFSTITVMEIKV